MHQEDCQKANIALFLYEADHQQIFGKKHKI